VIENLLQEGDHPEQQLRFAINYPRNQAIHGNSEIPEVRLWFICLIPYPWLPFLLDWKVGEHCHACATPI